MRNIVTKNPAVAACAILALALSFNEALADSSTPSPESVADALHAALVAGNAEAVQALLDPAVLIFESGGVERSLEEYASHHMHSDMAFLSSMDSELLDRQVFASGESCVVASRSRIRGTFRDKTMDLFSTETLVLHRAEAGWKIRHIHWSSRPAQ